MIRSAILAFAIISVISISARGQTNSNPPSYTAAANGGLTLTGTAFSLGDGVGISYTSPGKLTLSGSGALLTSPAVAIGGATLGSNALAVTGNIGLGNNTNIINGTGYLDIQVAANAAIILGTTVVNDFAVKGTTIPSFGANNTSIIGWTSGVDANSGTIDTMFTRQGTANIHLGAADAAAPIAQTLGVQSVVAGTSNTPGVLWTSTDSAGTGNQPSGGIAWQTHPLGTSGSGQNAAVTKMALSSAGDFSLAQYVSCTALTTNSSGQLLCNGSVP